MAETESVYPVLAEKFKADKRREIGLEGMTDEEIFATVYTFLHVMPSDAMWRLAGKLTASRSLNDRLKARQLAVVLFAQQECNRLVRDLSPQEKMEIAAELFQDGSLEVVQPGGPS